MTELLSFFNNHFCSVASNLEQNSLTPPFSFEHYVPDPLPFSLNLQPTSPEEVSKVIKSMSETSPGHDKIDIKIINLVWIYTNIINRNCHSKSVSIHLQCNRL